MSIGKAVTAETRKFLFLQGPHGPFFHRLGKMLVAAGCDVWRVGFNAGDRAFWFTPKTYIPFTDRLEAWPDRFEAIAREKAITDIVIYGDTRPVHSEAVERARAMGLRIHVFEEGYMRPYWVTYERDGSNGNSRLMEMPVSEMCEALERSDLDVPEAPTHWGDMNQHIFYGFLYHLFVMTRNGDYRNIRTHRSLPVAMEFYIYLKRFLLLPVVRLDRGLSTFRIKQAGFPFHLVLMQLEHDSAFQMHSPFETMREFLELTIKGFAEGAPRHHHLVFKAHPMESGRLPMRRVVRDLARQYGVKGRVHYVPGGKLAKLLNHARTAVTVNSTAAQQVLWRGIPLKVFGAAVYAKPEFVSTQPLAQFFAAPERPDNRAYKDYRRFLLETSQMPGGFYSARGRRELMRQVVDMMLAPEDPYEAFLAGSAAPRQQLRLVKD
ncbi:MAG: capsular biosynthesis protein [Pseudomonadota bacterium]